MKLKFVVSLFVVVVLLISVVNALEDGYCVNAEITDISPSSVKIGKEFTVGMHIENCGNDIPEDVSFEILSLPTDITIKESLVTRVSSLSCHNSERFLNYHMKTSNDAKPGTYLIKARLNYGKGEYFVQKDADITIDVIGDEAELNLASVKTKPILPYVGDTIELTLRVENFGDGTANSVEVHTDHPFKGIKKSFIGTLDSDEDGPVVFTFIANEAGEFDFPIEISYEDDLGENKINAEINLVVMEKKTDWRNIILSVGAILIIIVLIFYYFRTKKAKNKIIQQLLKGAHLKDEGKKGRK